MLTKYLIFVDAIKGAFLYYVINNNVVGIINSTFILK